jgi:hypothetical protein
MQMWLCSSGNLCLLGASSYKCSLIGAGPLLTYQIYGQTNTSAGPIAATTHTFTGLDHGVTYQFQVIPVVVLPLLRLPIQHYLNTS